MVYCTPSDALANKLFREIGICPDAYFALLNLMTVAFGHWVHRKVEGVESRKWTSTACGILVMLATCGGELWHVVLVICIAAALIKRADNRSPQKYMYFLHLELGCFLLLRSHLTVAALMATYLTTFRIYTLHNSNAFLAMNTILMCLTLKIVGVAFETHNSRKGYRPYLDGDNRTNEPSYGDILHYCFTYIGWNGVAYIRYRTYDDFIRMPFYKYAFDKGFKKKIIFFILSLVGFISFDAMWPLDYMNTDDFEHRSILYKLTYSVIIFQIFELWMYSYTTMGECICSAAGFGGYPVQFESVYTYGPTKNYDKLNEMSEQDAQRSEYDFTTNTTMDVYVIQTCPWANVCQKKWNIPVQYFMGMYVYKTIPKIKYIHSFRKILTFVVCGLWHGIEIGYLISLLVVSVYLPTDELFLTLYSKLNGSKAQVLSVTMYVFRYYYVAFGAITFMLRDLEEMMKFFNAVYYLPLVLLPLVHLIGVVLLHTWREKNQLNSEIKSD